jgi:transposase
MVDEELAKMTRLFDGAYADTGRPGVPPERLLKALLLQCLYSMRSETALVERIDTDLLFRWFLDMDPAEPVFDQTAFTHNRPRLERHGIVAAFFEGVVRRALQAGLASDEHFSVDGTLIESYASIKSFVPKDKDEDEDEDEDEPRDSNGFKPRNAALDFHGQRRSNATHQSTTDPEAKLYRKARGQSASLYHMGHAITENRHGLVMAVDVSEASGTAEPAAAVGMLERIKRRLRLKPRTLGSDKGYDGGPFLLELERRDICPHVPTRGQQKKIGGTCRRSKATLQRIKPLIEARQRMRRRERTLGYRLSQRCRKKIEEAIGWMKTVAGMCRTRLVGRWKIRQQLHLSAAAYNLVRIRKLAIA